MLFMFMIINSLMIYRTSLRWTYLLAKYMSNFWKTWSRKAYKNVISVDAIYGHTDNVKDF